jgi:hypothetical protein
LNDKILRFLIQSIACFVDDGLIYFDSSFQLNLVMHPPKL